MGVVLASLFTVSLLLVGSWLTYRFERSVVGDTEEPGPASLAAAGRIERRPKAIDPWMYHSAPLVALLGAGWATVVIPLGREWIGADLTIGLFYFLVVADFVVLAIALGGWGSNMAASVEACYRIVAQLVAYVVPLGLAVIGPIMMARSLSIVDIVQAQQESGFWYVFVQPIGFALYLATGLMQCYRAPFLEPFAGRLEAGVLGVYGGWKLVAWKTALSGLLFVVGAMGAALFLGGYEGPLLPPPLWMAIKTAAMIWLLLWVGRKVPLLTTAQMLALAWKALIPVGLLNVLIVGILILLGVGQSPFQ